MGHRRSYPMPLNTNTFTMAQVQWDWAWTLSFAETAQVQWNWARTLSVAECVWTMSPAEMLAEEVLSQSLVETAPNLCAAVQAWILSE